jgi:hypothetical protein
MRNTPVDHVNLMFCLANTLMFLMIQPIDVPLTIGRLIANSNMTPVILRNVGSQDCKRKDVAKAATFTTKHYLVNERQLSCQW